MLGTTLTFVHVEHNNAQRSIGTRTYSTPREQYSQRSNVVFVYYRPYWISCWVTAIQMGKAMWAIWAVIQTQWFAPRLPVPYIWQLYISLITLQLHSVFYILQFITCLESSTYLLLTLSHSVYQVHFIVIDNCPVICFLGPTLLSAHYEKIISCFFLLVYLLLSASFITETNTCALQSTISFLLPTHLIQSNYCIF